MGKEVGFVKLLALIFILMSLSAKSFATENACAELFKDPTVSEDFDADKMFVELRELKGKQLNSKDPMEAAIFKKAFDANMEILKGIFSPQEIIDRMRVAKEEKPKEPVAPPVVITRNNDLFKMAAPVGEYIIKKNHEAMEASPDLKYILTKDKKTSRYYISEISTGKTVHSFPKLDAGVHYERTSFQFRNGQSKIAYKITGVNGLNIELGVLDFKQKKKIFTHELKNKKNVTSHIKVSQDGSLVAITNNLNVTVFDLKAKTSFTKKIPFKKQIATLDFSADGQRLYLSGYNVVDKAHVLDIQTKKVELVPKFDGIKASEMSIVRETENTYFISNGKDKIYSINKVTGKFVAADHAFVIGDSASADYRFHKFYRDSDSTIHIFDMEVNREIIQVSRDENEVYGIHFGHNNEGFITTPPSNAVDVPVRIWEWQ